MPASNSSDDDDDVIIIRRGNVEVPIPKTVAGTQGFFASLRLAMAVFSVVRRR